MNLEEINCKDCKHWYRMIYGDKSPSRYGYCDHDVSPDGLILENFGCKFYEFGKNLSKDEYWENLLNSR